MHTKGPWINDRGTIRTEDGQVIAECHVYDQATNRLGGAERDCNAGAIVAIPELLKALALYTGLEQDHHALLPLSAADWAECYQAGQEAIAKLGGDLSPHERNE